MRKFMGILILLIVAVVIFIDFMVAKAFERIAFDKGYDESIHSFAWVFWLGIIGMIYVASLPRIERTTSKKFYNNLPTNEATYKEAIHNMDLGDKYKTSVYYEEAIKLFEKIRDYGDSEIKLKECREKMARFNY